MNKKMKKFLILFVFAFIFIGFDKKIFATTISFSNNNPKVGDSVKITVTVPNVHTSDVHAVINGPGINTKMDVVGADMNGEKKTYSNSVTVNPTETGKISVSITSNSNAIADGAYVNVGASAAANVSASSDGNQGGGSTGNPGGSNPGTTTPTKDSNANLSNLGIRPNDFTGFKPGTLNYNVNVPNDVSSIEVYAKAKSAKATVSGTGKKTLKEGKNNFPVTVTAEDGTKKTYTVSVIRKTVDEGEVPPNVIDEEGVPPVEEQPQGIGLATLEIEGYKLDKEFATDVYEYKVMLDKEITLTDLEEIKEKIKSVANNENVTVEVTAEVTEDGKNLIIIVVKDEEREYAKYIVTFEEKEEEKQEVLGLVADTSNSDNGSGNTGLFGLTFEQQLFIVLGCFGMTSLMALFFACSSYAKSRRLAEYEEDDEFSEENNFEAETMNGLDMGLAQSNIQEAQETTDEASGLETIENQTVDRINELETAENKTTGELVSDAASRLEKLNGYRSLRKGNRESGRHF